MQPDKNKNDESQSKGGRYPEKNAKFFTLKGNRSDELEILKMEFGADGVDFFVSVYETLCISDYFIYEFQNKHKLQLLAKKKDIEKELFLKILKFGVEELGLFNKELYAKGYIFSEAFLNTFDSGGLFKSRTITATDVRNKVNELISDVNHQLTNVEPRLTEVNPQPTSVEGLILNNSKTEDSKEEEKRKKENTIRDKLNNTRESEDDITKAKKLPFSSPEGDLPF